MWGRGESHLWFWLEVVAALWHRALAPLRTFWRRSWFYRPLLRGRMPGRIVLHPSDFAPRRLEEAHALLQGRFRFAGETADIRKGTIFDQPRLSPPWVEALHSFVWLPPLAQAGGEPARVLATNLIGQWLRRYARYSEPAWRADVLARRLVSLFAHSRFVLAKADVMWRSKLLVSLREQSRMLARTSREAPDGLPRLEAAAAHALSGICLDDGSQRLESGLALLRQECARQILPDGGHISRSPSALLDAYRQLTIMSGTLAAIGQTLPRDLLDAQERMGAMLRFFRLGDGTLALFNGGKEGQAKLLAKLLARDQVRAQPEGSATDSGYERLVAGRSIVVMDCGRFPSGALSQAAHAGCFSFEFSAGQQRIVVNCGAAADRRWSVPLRLSAAHSTITLSDSSVGRVLSGRLAHLLGPRLVNGPTVLRVERQRTGEDGTVEASHDGYLPLFGILHQRRLILASNGRMLSGYDRLAGGSHRHARNPVPFAARFHIHPDVRVSGSYGGDILLKLPSGEGWRFQAKGADISMARSVYLGGDTLRRCEQLVLSGSVQSEPAELTWSFERIG